MEERERRRPLEQLRGATVTQRYLDISMTIFKETLNEPFLLEKEPGKPASETLTSKNNITFTGSKFYG